MPSLLSVPSFADGQLMRFDDLNAITYDTDALAQITLGRALTSGSSSKPLCKVNLVQSQSVANNASAGGAEVIDWDAMVVDTDGMWNAATPTYVTIQTAGWYWIYLQVMWASGAAAARVTQIAVNGTADPQNITSSTNTTMGAAGAVTQQCIAYEHLAVGASVSGMSFQNCGSALNMLANGRWGTYMSVAYADPF